MKTGWLVLGLLCLALASGHAADLSAALQKGLFEEEANQDLDAAIQAYSGVAQEFDRDRKLAGTAIFRLGECYRKLGKTNEAVLHYQRVLREFSDLNTLANLSRQNISVLSAARANDGGSAKQTLPAGAALTGTLTSDEAEEVKRIRALIQDSPDLINAKVGNGTRLHKAVEAGQLVVATFLLENGADVEARGNSDATPLHTAGALGHRAIAQLLIANKANVNSTDSGGNTPLHLAAGQGFRAVVEVLVAAKADVNARSKSGNTPLHVACGAGQKTIAELLIAQGAEVNARTFGDDTPLHEAARGGHAAVIALLLDKGADINARNHGLLTPLFQAVSGEKVAAVRLLLAMNADPDLPGGGGDTAYPIHMAVLQKQPEMLALLITNRANLNVRFESKGQQNGYTPLLMAIMEKRERAVELLLQHKANPDIPDSYGNTPLHCSLGQKYVFGLVLAAKPAVNAKNKSGQTPLHWAVSSSLRDVVEQLLRAGANINEADQKGMTPLHMAVIRDEAMAELLLVNKADPNLPDNEGRTPLMWINDPGSYSMTTAAPGVTRLVLSQMPVPLRPPGVRSATVSSPIAEVLKKHGALTEIPTIDRIRVGRSAIQSNWTAFQRDTNAWNRFTLLEAIGASYLFLGTSPEGGGRSYEAQTITVNRLPIPIAFPDLERIQIRRPAVNPTRWEVLFIKEVLSINVAEILNSGDCTKDVPLEWGDVIEIPEADHLVNVPWTGFSWPTLMAMNKCWSREVEIVVKGNPTKLTLGAEIEEKGTGPGPTVRTSAPFWIKPVLRNSGLILASSDLARVKVIRTDKSSGKKTEILLDCSDGKPAPAFWLRDGDRIEIPDRA